MRQRSKGATELSQMQRQYEFSWDLLGDITLGRPNLGPTTRLEVYRLAMFSIRDVLEKRLGQAEADTIFYQAGYLAGSEFYQHLFQEQGDFQQCIVQLQQLFRELGIGIVRIENADLATGKIVLTIAEDLDCSGLPESGTEICVYDEGFLAGVLYQCTKKQFVVKEIDCWCTGSRVCRFSAVIEE